MPERAEPIHHGFLRIEAILWDGSHHLFSPRVLDVMLANKRVAKFKRKSGWVTIGVDPVRVCRLNDACHVYYGRERRRPLARASQI